MIEDISIILVATLVSGSLYSLMTIGLVLVSGTARYFNFAHGAFATFGAYFVWYLFVVQKMDYRVSFLLLIPVALAVGFLMQRYTVQSLIDREASDLILILQTFAVGSIIESTILLIFGGRLKRCPYPFEGHISIGGATMSYHKLLILLASSLLIIALITLLYKTKLGTAMRAVAQEKEAAPLVGINVNRIYGLTLGIASIMAGVAGYLIGCMEFMTPTLGGGLMSGAFIICSLGGTRAGLRGAAMTSYLVAFMESALMRYLPMYDVPPIIFALVIIGLIIRPEGLFVRGAR